MFKLKSVTLKNFLSVGNVTQAIKLDEHGLTLVLGNNSDSNGGITKNGAGKAQSLSSLIKVPNGWKRMGDIQSGDTITAWDGTRCKVTAVHPQGVKPLYEMTFSDGRKTKACLDHLWKTWIYQDGQWQWVVTDTQELISHMAKDIPSRRVFVPLASHEITPESFLPVDPRLLGLLIGDGGMTGSKIVFSSMDSEIISYMEEVLPEGYHLRAEGKCDHVITRGESGRGHKCVLREKLTELGLIGCYSYDKFIPDIYMNASEYQKTELLSGLIDTDGHVGKNGEISYTSTSERLAADVEKMVRSLGGIAYTTSRITKYTHMGEKKEGRRSYTVRLRYHNPRALMRLSRKLDRVGNSYQYSDNLKLRLTSISYVGDEEAQCISIDHHDHLYITDNYIVTHNTAITQAISYALYGQPLTKIKVDNLINNINQKGMMVTLDFDIDDQSYRIERGRKPNIMRLYRNDEDITDLSQGENRETQHLIDKLVGMEFNLFSHVVILTTNVVPFLKLKAAEQREVSEELLGVTQISTRAETLKKLVNETKEGIRQQTSDTKAIQEANSRIENAIRQAEDQLSNWQKKHDQSVRDLASQIEELGGIDFDSEKVLFDQLDAWQQHRRGLTGRLDSETTTLTRIKSDIARSETEKDSLANHQSKMSAVVRLEAEKERKKQTITDTEMSVSALVAKLVTKVEEIANPDSHECVTCHQALTGTDHLKTVLANLDRQKAKLESDIEQKRLQVSALRSEVESVEHEIVSIHEEEDRQKEKRDGDLLRIEGELTTLRNNLLAQQRTIDGIKDDMAGDEDRPQTFFTDRDELYATKHLLESCTEELERERVKDNPHVQHLESLRDTLQSVSFDEMDRLQDMLRHQEFLMKLLTNKDSFIRKKIIDQNLYYLNTRLNFYLEKLGLPHEVVFQNDLTVDISLLGKDYDFEQLSRGEMNRVIMAVSWSFRDVWESLNHTINLIWVDELIDSGLDSNGAEAALSIMKSFSRNRKNVFLISHRDELVGRIDRTLTVTKENGFTTISEDLT